MPADSRLETLRAHTHTHIHVVAPRRFHVHSLFDRYTAVFVLYIQPGRAGLRIATDHQREPFALPPGSNRSATANFHGPLISPPA